MSVPRPGPLVVVLVAMLAGCGTATTAPPPATSSPSAPSATTPSAVPSAGASASSPVSSAGDPWAQADVALPSAVTSAPSLQPGYQCHPCHYLAENDFLGVTATQTGAVAVGVQEPPAQPIAYSSTDGTHWAPLAGSITVAGEGAVAGESAVAGASANAVAANGGRVVVVGLEHSGATAWALDGGAWAQAPAQAALEVPYAAGGMTAVTAFGSGFVAGGYRDDPLHDRASAAVWRSGDGLTWRLDDGAGLFAGGRIWGIAAKAGTIVAVGTGGDPNYGPAAVWRWTQADGWRRGRIEPDTSGAMRAVTATSTGFVAVGLDGTDHGALSWTSSDGFTWTAAPDQPAFHFASLPVRMQAVAVGPSGLVAGGWRSDQGKGSAVTWTSPDGVTWQGPLWEPSFSGGQITGVVAIGGTMVAVGRIGYPDWNQASAWSSRAP